MGRRYGVSARAVRATFTWDGEWHHTGAAANETRYYNPPNDNQIADAKAWDKTVGSLKSLGTLRIPLSSATVPRTQTMWKRGRKTYTSSEYTAPAHAIKITPGKVMATIVWADGTTERVKLTGSRFAATNPAGESITASLSWVGSGRANPTTTISHYAEAWREIIAANAEQQNTTP